MKNKVMKFHKKVLVAMSGGVDSSVAALLLQKKGYVVAGAFMKNFSPESWKGIIQKDCPWEEDQGMAKKVCRFLKIPFYSFNFEKEYEKTIISYFFRGYKNGITPNPDILCNKEIKFKLFLAKAISLGYDYIATGHYAKNIQYRVKRKLRSFHCLAKGKDAKKDQSYFLYSLNQYQLRKSLFPLGNVTKKQVRYLARKNNLPNADKKDSQGLCFVGHIKLKTFLEQKLPALVGDIIDEYGQVIGHHQGAWYYTIGQRHGLNIGGGIPYYVAKKDVKNNILYVVRGKKNKINYKNRLLLHKVHWILPMNRYTYVCSAKIRYRQKDQKCRIARKENHYLVSFIKPQFAVASGQSVVFYKDDFVLGGGIIL